MATGGREQPPLAVMQEEMVALVQAESKWAASSRPAKKEYEQELVRKLQTMFRERNTAYVESVLNKLAPPVTLEEAIYAMITDNRGLRLLRTSG